MSKFSKQSSYHSNLQPIPSFQKNILPLKRTFITFQSEDHEEKDYSGQVASILIKNPKWCNLALKLRRHYCKDGYTRLRRCRSLRLSSINLEVYSFDPQGIDSIWPYSGELDSLTRAASTLKKLSLSVTRDKRWWINRDQKDEACVRLKRFVKRQKYLEEFGLYMGEQGEPKWMAELLKYIESSVRTLTIQNMSVADIFVRYGFLELKILRFEYIQFEDIETTFDFAILEDSLADILSLPSLQTLVISQYQNFQFDPESEEDSEREEQQDEQEKFTEDQTEADYQFSSKEDDFDIIPLSDEEMEDQEERGEDVSRNTLIEFREEDYLSDRTLQEDTDKIRLDPDEEDENDEAYIDRIIDDEEGEDDENEDEDDDESSCSELAKHDDKLKEQKIKLKKTAELNLEFWMKLRRHLDEDEEMPLRIKYHKKDDSCVEEKVENFKKIFTRLPVHQTFEYEVSEYIELTEDESKTGKTEMEDPSRGCCHSNPKYKGARFLISRDEVEHY